MDDTFRVNSDMRFGLVRANGDFKPVAAEVKSFSTVCGELTSEKWEPVVSPQVGRVVPSAYYQLLAFDCDNSFEEWYPLYLDTFANLKRANLQVRCIFEPAGESDSRDKSTFLLGLGAETYLLLVLPRTKRISAPFWSKILQFVDNGGNLYLSFARDHWIVDWENTFGITSDVRFGLPALPEPDEVSFSVVADWLRQQTGDSCTIPVRDNSVEMAYCPVTHHSGETLIEDQDGNPVLLRQPYGKGSLYLSLYPPGDDAVEVRGAPRQRLLGADA